MSAKFFIYIFVALITVWTLESINVNNIFKKNRVLQARVFYVLLTLSITYLVSNFIYDFFLSTQII